MTYRDDLTESQIKAISDRLRNNGAVDDNSCYEVTVYQRGNDDSYVERYCEFDNSVGQNTDGIDFFGLTLENAIRVCVEGSADITSVGGLGPEDLLKTIN